ncbi:hypothetical protein GQ602_000943 [Ophiocordyceps camponoti-floridani]|uniref:Uncharacterized protein n=1 Tax=Ophiocordyceps camponoti-floridani TaxID=2030778 RepID=A0A8H4QD46_9HYPO|nr:hypothetical protein GQ602_000943 [Ophiocordyceps camponoti-floridani]
MKTTLLFWSALAELAVALDWNKEAGYLKCKERLPKNSCLRELYFLWGDDKMRRECAEGGQLADNVPLKIDSAWFFSYEYPVVCAQADWTKNQASSRIYRDSSVTIRAEDYGIICDSCYSRNATGL